MPKWWFAPVALVTFVLSWAASAGAQAPTPDALAAARELIVVMKLDEQVKAVMPAIMQGMKPALTQGRPEVERDYDQIVPSLLAVMSARIAEMSEMIAALYARHFTVEEMRELIAFYRAPTGQKLQQKMPALMQESMLLGQSFGQSIAPDVQNRMIEELRKRGHKI